MNKVVWTKGIVDFIFNLGGATLATTARFTEEQLKEKLAKRFGQKIEITAPSPITLADFISRDWIKTGIVEKKQKQEKEPMKNLYQVVVVTIYEEIILDKKTVAADVDEAKFNVEVDQVIRKMALKPKEITVLVDDLGEVKVRKEAQKVEIVKE